MTLFSKAYFYELKPKIIERTNCDGFLTKDAIRYFFECKVYK